MKTTDELRNEVINRSMAIAAARDELKAAKKLLKNGPEIQLLEEKVIRLRKEAQTLLDRISGK